MTPWPPRASDSYQSRLSPPASRLNALTFFALVGLRTVGSVHWLDTPPGVVR
jgi:hypothetical protein